jgi:hypothetical protein
LKYFYTKKHHKNQNHKQDCLQTKTKQKLTLEKVKAKKGITQSTYQKTRRIPEQKSVLNYAATNHICS